MNAFKRTSLRHVFLWMFLLCALPSVAQRLPRPAPGVPGGLPNVRNQKQTKDTAGLGFEHRDDLADSITISYRYLDSLTSNRLDSSINDFGKFYSVPTGYITLGNNGNAAFPVLFSPVLKAGWDEGLHAFDVYKYSVENTRFYQTTRPFTRLDYFLGSETEQVIRVLHTQNIKPNWNVGINYRLISAPGFFKTQNTNHNNYRFFSNYQGKRKRYSAYIIVLANKLESSENGGIQNDSFLHDPNLKKRKAIPVQLAGGIGPGNQIFSTSITTGNKYDNFTAFFRQSYDLGKKDSIKVNDSTTNYLFYPKLRFQHTIQYKTNRFSYTDPLTERGVSAADSLFYAQNYQILLKRDQPVNIRLEDSWQMISNDFSIRQFPQTKNTGQYLEAGARVENFAGEFTRFTTAQSILQIFPPPSIVKNYLNVVLHGEYRNKTRNKKWDAFLTGEFYAAGYNVADFNVQAMLTRFLNKKLGDVQVSFQNINRTPSYIFNSNSAFNLDSVTSPKKENITLITFRADNPRFTIMARNISIANYAYLKNYYQTDQFGLVNLTQGSLATANRLTEHFNLYSDFIVQQTTGKNPVRVPLFYTRQRLAFEGNFFKNLNLSTGLDLRYNTPYKADNYSPVLGSFFPQDSVTISNLPTVNFFFNFRIKSFTAFISAENLNSVSFTDGFAFMNNNFSAPNYPIPGFLFRFAVKWAFVN